MRQHVAPSGAGARSNRAPEGASSAGAATLPPSQRMWLHRNGSTGEARFFRERALPCPVEKFPALMGQFPNSLLHLDREICMTY